MPVPSLLFAITLVVSACTSAHDNASIALDSGPASEADLTAFEEIHCASPQAPLSVSTEIRKDGGSHYLTAVRSDFKGGEFGKLLARNEPLTVKVINPSPAVYAFYTISVQLVLEHRAKHRGMSSLGGSMTWEEDGTTHSLTLSCDVKNLH